MPNKKLSDEMLSIYQLAELLGRSVTAVYVWNERGYIPAPVKFGGRLRWRRYDVQKWIAAGFPARQPEAIEKVKT